MGQYGNQPDFATGGKNIVPTGEPGIEGSSDNLGSAALYVGTGGDFFCKIIGDKDTLFRNVPNGTFFPSGLVW
jgi:hypothetical protein